jgi:hypothetical protein
MSCPAYAKEKDTPIQIYDCNAKRKKNENLETTFIDKEENLKAASELFMSLFFCIHFWILFNKVVA